VARVLLLMANFGKEGKAEPVIPKISQEMLGSANWDLSSTTVDWKFTARC
jgi:hypothetical protein